MHHSDARDAQSRRLKSNIITIFRMRRLPTRREPRRRRRRDDDGQRIMCADDERTISIEPLSLSASPSWRRAVSMNMHHQLTHFLARRPRAQSAPLPRRHTHSHRSQSTIPPLSVRLADALAGAHVSPSSLHRPLASFNSSPRAADRCVSRSEPASRQRRQRQAVPPHFPPTGSAGVTTRMVAPEVAFRGWSR